MLKSLKSLKNIQGKSALKHVDAFSPVFPSAEGVTRVLTSDETVGEALRKLVSYNINALPVLSLESKGYTAWFSVLDAVCVIVVSAEIEGDGKINPSLLDIKIGKVTGQIPATRRFLTVTNKHSGYDAAKIMVEEDVHRVGVLNEKKELVSVITDSRLLRFVTATESTSKASVGSATLAKLGMVDREKKPYYVFKHTKAIDAFNLMREKGVSGLAVLEEHEDNSRTLAGHISASDLASVIAVELEEGTKNVLPSILGAKLRGTVGEFLSFAREAKDDSTGVKLVSTYARETDTLRDTSQRISYWGIHKLYVREKGQYVGVVTINDILKQYM